MAEREMTAAPVRLAMLHTRAAPSARIHDDWVAWLIDEHMPQLTAGSRLLGSWCYRSSAAGSTTGPHYMVSYLAPDLATLREWLASPRLEAALADGLRWVGEFDALEGETFTGNVYVQAWASPGADARPWREAVHVRRFESAGPAPGHHLAGPAPDHHRWAAARAATAEADALVATDDVAGVSLWSGIRDVAIPHYRSAGNRMIVCGLAGPELPAAAAAGIGALQDLETCSGYATATGYRLLASVAGAGAADGCGSPAQETPA
jgi:hypothetical protein